MKRVGSAAMVRDLRDRLGLTQEQFAQRIGVTYSTVNHWENGKRAPQPFLLARLLELGAELRAAAPETVAKGQAEPTEGTLPVAVRAMVDRIVRRFRPERVILFGSHARGDAGPESDVDLLVVMEVEGSRRQKQLEVRREVHDVRGPKDVLVTTPEEFEWRRRVPGTVERSAALEGRLVYARR